MDENSIRRLGSVLTAVAELALLSLRGVKWVTGKDAIRLREHFELVCEVLEDANDRIDKNGEE